MKIDKTLRTAVTGSAIALLAVSGSAWADSHEPTTTYKFGGYAKFDAMFSDYSDGTPASGNILRQFYIPSAIPTGDGSSSGDPTIDLQARESRINFRADTTTAGGSKVTAFFEMDFFTTSNGNEFVSNSRSPRLRHAFLKYDNWTFGQTWSTFQDVGALPEALDFVGPAESTTFVRQAMIRYTTGNLELAVENPESFLSGVYTDDTEETALAGPGHDTMPDLIARYTIKFDGGYIKVAGLLRSLNVDQQFDGGAVADDTGYGVSVSAKFNVGEKNDIRAMVTFGDGVGRYLGLGIGRDAHYNSDTSQLETIEQTAAYLAYRHFWNSKWRSNIMYGTNSLDNPVSAGGGATEEASSFHFNLIYNPLPKLDIGAEIMWAERKEVSGEDGDFTRFLLSAKYAF